MKKPTWKQFEKSLWTQYKEMKERIAAQDKSNGNRYLQARDELIKLKQNPHEYKTQMKPMKYMIRHCLKFMPMEQFLKDDEWLRWANLKHYMLKKDASYRQKKRDTRGYRRFKLYHSPYYRPGHRAGYKATWRPIVYRKNFYKSFKRSGPRAPYNRRYR